MEILSEAGDIIQSAEEKIRQLMGRAALAGDYDALVTLTSWGKTLSSLVVQQSPQRAQRLAAADGRGQTQNDTEVRASADPTPTENRDRRTKDRSRSEPSPLPLAKTPAPAAIETPNRRTKRNNPAAKYPQFLRFGGDLIKVGWSKKLRTEYEHKSPTEVVDLLAATLANLGSDGRRFTMEEVLPHMKLRDGLDVPTYQTYLCLAWLRDAGLLHQHGRQGYSVSTEGPLSEQVKSRWRDLPLKK